VLTGVVKASRDLRLEREAREEAEAKLAAQREREQATRRALVRARQIAAGCAVLAVLAIGSAVYGYFATERAKAAEAKSEDTRLMAEQARGEAEKLVVYLLDDFQLELAPVGRLDIVAELAKRAIDYYNGLPAALRTPQSERNRALALVRYGSVLRTQARMDEGNKAVDEAVKILGDLREQGDRSEPTTIGLALGLATQARLVQGGGGGNDKAALALSERASEVIKPVATAPNSSVALRRTLGEVLLGQGFILDRLRDPRAFPVLDEAREAFRSIDGLSMTDLPSAAGYAESTVWKVQALMNAGRADEAAELGKESLAVSRRIIEKRPGHMQALRAQAVSTSTLARAHLDRLQPLEALKMSDATVAAWEEFLRLDASNVVSLFNLGVARFGRANALLELGRVGEAAATLREMTKRYESATPSLFLNDQISFANMRLAGIEASRGNARAAEEAMRRGDAARDWQVKNSPPGSWRAQSRPLYNLFTQALVAGQLGDDRRVLELGRDLAPKLAALTATDQGSTLEKANTRRSLSVSMALVAYRLGDYAAAERATTVALEQWRVLRPDELGERRDEASDRALRALVLVRLGRQDEARELAGPVLALQRGLASKNQGSAGQRFELAQALIAAATAGMGDARAQRAEAARLIDGLPEGFRDTSDVKFWRARLVEVAARP
jgi:tetratricopeptide (TPR) repeat protein